MHHFLALVLSKSVQFMGILGKLASVTRKADLGIHYLKIAA